MKKICMYIVLLACWLASLLYDKEITLFITQNRIELINGFVIWLTNPLIIIAIFLLMTTLFLWSEKKRGWIIPLWLTIAKTSVIILLMKIIISRPRPFEILTFPLIKGVDYAFSVWNTSFPSMHAALVFSLVPILDEEFPKLKWFWIIAASLIAFSRLYIGVHYTSDILAGCIIGLLVGHVILHLEKKYKIYKKWYRTLKKWKKKKLSK